MKIIQVCPRYSPDIGGVETHVKEISERLVTRGFDVEVVCTDPSGKHKKEENINGVAVKRFRSLAPNEAYYFAPQIYFYLKKANCDVIHAHSYHAFPAFFASFAKKDRKFVFTPHFHGRGHTVLRNILHKPYKVVGSRIFKEAQSVICVSLYERDLINKHFDIPSEKLVFIPNGINLEDFSNNGTHKEKKTILYVGRLERYKGVQLIIKALPYLEGYRLVIVGKGPYEGELRKSALRLDVSERIRWLKNLSREELVRQYESAGIFVFLSSLEAFGIAVAEAIASGTPCIVTKTGALTEFVDEQVCFGLDVPVDTSELAKRIFEVSRSDINFQSFPNEKIKSWDEVVDEYEKIYRGI